MKSILLKDYYISLKNSGFQVSIGDGEYLWVKHERLSAIRFPEFNTSIPTEIEIKRVFRELKCLIISYIIKIENLDESNSILYECTDTNYNSKNLSKNVIRDIHIGQNYLTYGFVEWKEILGQGLKAFADTRRRVRLSDGNLKNFTIRFNEFSLNPAHKAVAAKLNGQIVAFMSLIIVDDFVIIQGSFSTDENKKLCPNNVLIDYVLNYFLNEQGFNNVCYGLSSIQDNAGNTGLHNYKIRVGFKENRVRRKFLLRSSIMPYKKGIGLIIRFLLTIFPTNRQLRKAAGIFSFLSEK